MMDNLERRSSRPMSAMSTPSILIHPEESSDSRNKQTPNELFPDPVLPTIPRWFSRNQFITNDFQLNY